MTKQVKDGQKKPGDLSTKTRVCCLIGAALFGFASIITGGKIPIGGAIWAAGGALIGGIVGAILNATVNLVRKK